MLRFEFQTKLWKSTGLIFWVGILYLTAHHQYSQYWWLMLRVHPKFVQIIHLKLITWRNTNMVQRWFKSHIRGWWNLSLVKSWSLDQICESNTIKGWPPVLHSTSWLLPRFWRTLNSCCHLNLLLCLHLSIADYRIILENFESGVIVITPDNKLIIPTCFNFTFVEGW